MKPILSSILFDTVLGEIMILQWRNKAVTPLRFLVLHTVLQIVSG